MSLARTLGRYGQHRARSRGLTCELCGAATPESHAHVADLSARSLACACQPCAILFAQPGAGGGRYRTVPTRVLSGGAFTLQESDWIALGIPVRLAFFFHSTPKSWVALYPGPAGATESELPEAAWNALSLDAPLVAELTPDVEAIVAWAHRGASRAECFLVPITACYELVARLRLAWKGIDGGDEARAALATFFEDLRARTRTVGAARGVS